MADMQEPPNPGSSEAKDLGCLCPRMDNSHGQPGVFVIVDGCPVHTEQGQVKDRYDAPAKQ